MYSNLLASLVSNVAIRLSTTGALRIATFLAVLDF
jgi:hypothetical protein